MAPLPPLATVADLGTVPASASSEDIALALRWGSARVRRYTGQAFTFVEDETVELDGGERVLRLPQRPLVVDASHPLTVVEIPGYAGVEITLTEDTDYTRLGSELTAGIRATRWAA